MEKFRLIEIPAAPPFPNSRLPVILYPQAMERKGDLASRLVALFARHGWPDAWVNGVYSFDHFHAQAHEVLGCARGSARLRLGGPEGQAFDIRAGDIVLLPAGTGHCRISASADFSIVGSYPAGQSPDMQRGSVDAYDILTIQARQVPLLHRDPELGASGPAVQAWREALKG